MLLSVNESQHQACTDPLLQQRRIYFAFIIVISVDSSGKRRMWKFLYSILHSSGGVSPWEMLSCGCLPSTAVCGECTSVTPPSVFLLSCSYQFIVSSVQAVFPHQNTFGFFSLGHRWSHVPQVSPGYSAPCSDKPLLESKPPLSWMQL